MPSSNLIWGLFDQTKWDPACGCTGEEVVMSWVCQFQSVVHLFHLCFSCNDKWKRSIRIEGVRVISLIWMRSSLMLIYTHLLRPQWRRRKDWLKLRSVLWHDQIVSGLILRKSGQQKKPTKTHEIRIQTKFRGGLNMRLNSDFRCMSVRTSGHSCQISKRRNTQRRTFITAAE